MKAEFKEILSLIRDLQSYPELSIIKLSEPISAIPAHGGEKRASDESAEPLEIPSAASLDADLCHYKVIPLALCCQAMFADDC